MIRLSQSTMRKPNCRTCGICCVAPSEQSHWVELSDSDIKRLGPSYMRRNGIWTVDGLAGVPAIKTVRKTQKAGPLRGCIAISCASLRGSLLHRTSCAVYDRRPDACRDMRAGSAECRQVRAAVKDLARDLADRRSQETP